MDDKRSMEPLQPAPACLADIIVRSLRGKWAMPILLVVGENGGRHFNHLRRAIPGISAKVLTEQLRYLMAAGVVQRQPSGSEVVYSYTERGKELRALLDSMNTLAQRWQSADHPPQPLPSQHGHRSAHTE